MQATAVLCVDFGSTFTKAALVDGETGELLGTASHRHHPRATDVLDGLDACRAELARPAPGRGDAEVLACSSAGGGLRIAVVGNEELVTAEAGRRVALSSGGKVVAVLGRVSDDALYRVLGHTTRPDVVLLTGGTDGGDEDGILLGARRIAASGWHGPVVVAGNVDAQAEVAALLGEPAGRRDRQRGPADRRARARSPRAGRSARCSWRHVIGGKHLSRRADFTAMVRGATPDLVLTGVEVLAAETGRKRGRGGRHRRRHHRRALGGEARSRGRRALS